jgi:cellobiose phosphorylase
MLRAVLEYFCGIQPGYAGLDIKPCLPTSWDEVRVVRKLRGKKYDIYIKRNNDKYEIFINDQLSPNGFISYSS